MPASPAEVMDRWLDQPELLDWLARAVELPPELHTNAPSEIEALVTAILLALVSPERAERPPALH